MAKKSQETKKKIITFKSDLIADKVISNEKKALDLHKKEHLGEIIEDSIHFSLQEGLYLIEKKKTKIYFRKKILKREDFIKKATKIEAEFYIKYIVYKDLKDKGYIVKTALKFGAEFRVYDKGVKPGENHAKWILYPVRSTKKLTWQEFASKNRVAHSTRKALLIGVVDSESDVTYYTINWEKP